MAQETQAMMTDATAPHQTTFKCYECGYCGTQDVKLAEEEETLHIRHQWHKGRRSS